MFTTPCFIRKNTPELREKLEKLGYKNKYHKQDIYYNGLHIGEGLIVSTCSHIYGGIDCEENETLFLAIAAMRDDSDYMQWFVSNNKCRWGTSGAPFYHWYKCTSKEQSIGGYRKATVQELKERFK